MKKSLGQGDSKKSALQPVRSIVLQPPYIYGILVYLRSRVPKIRDQLYFTQRQDFRGGSTSWKNLRLIKSRTNPKTFELTLIRELLAKVGWTTLRVFANNWQTSECVLYKSEIYEWILQNTTNLRFAKYDHYGEKYVSARSYDTVCVKHLPPILNNFLYV